MERRKNMSRTNGEKSRYEKPNMYAKMKNSRETTKTTRKQNKMINKHIERLMRWRPDGRRERRTEMMMENKIEKRKISEFISSCERVKSSATQLIAFISRRTQDECVEAEEIQSFFVFHYSTKVEEVREEPPSTECERDTSFG